MADETVITWSVQNWITVILMAVVGYAVFAVGAQLFHKAQAKKAAE